MIPHSRPFIGRKEVAAVQKVILSGQLAMGNVVNLLEQELCLTVGHRYALAVSSGTMALYAALHALGVRKNDRVIIPSFACTALANAVCMLGALPVLCEVEYSNGLVSVATVKAALVKKTRAIIVPHLFGCMAPADDIERECGIPVVEDCAQCIGASVDGKITGSLTSISTFSFYATKVIGAGEGGAVATSNEKIASVLEAMREYDHKEVWTPQFNSKCSDIHAALARVQLGRLPAFVKRRRIIARQYTAALPSTGFAVPFPVATAEQSMFFRYILRISKRHHSRVMKFFATRRITVARPVYKPFHRYIGLGQFPVTDRLFDELVSIPLYPSLTKKEIVTITTALSALNTMHKNDILFQ